MKRQFVSSNYNLNNDCLKELVDLIDKYDYDLDSESDEILVFEYLAELVCSESYEDYIEDTLEQYEEILAIIEHENNCEELIEKFEKIFEYASSEIKCDKLVIDFLDIYYSQKKHTESVLRHHVADSSENLAYINKLFVPVLSFKTTNTKFVASLL